jgi:nicotinate phosphoribosyltransferase
LSEQAIKISTPGIQQVRRYYTDKEFVADMIYDTESFLPQDTSTMIDPMDYTKRRKLNNSCQYEDLLIPVFRKGEQVYTLPSIEESKKRVKHQLTMFHEGIKRFANPHTYPVGLEKGLYDFKTDLILQLRNLKSEAEEV